MHVVDHRLRQAGLECHLLVDVPFELRVAMPPGDEDGELLEMRRQRGAEAQELAELLPLVGELGAMQHRAQRTAQLAAWPGDDRVVDAALLRRHLVTGKERNARQCHVSCRYSGYGVTRSPDRAAQISLCNLRKLACVAKSGVGSALRDCPGIPFRSIRATWRMASPARAGSPRCARRAVAAGGRVRAARWRNASARPPAGPCRRAHGRSRSACRDARPADPQTPPGWC